jgi:hypothetical protein
VWDGLPDDPTAFDRQLRLIKSLVKMGKLIRLGDKIEAAK